MIVKLTAAQKIRVANSDDRSFNYSETSYKSLETEGIMHKLRNSGAWQLIDSAKAELNEMRAEMEKEEADKKARLEIGKKMKADGYTIEVIKKLTKLTLGEIRRL